MLKIRKEQNDELAKAALKRFEDSMVVHLNKFFPEECELLGADGTRQAIRYAVERAAGYDIVSERDVCVYADVMFAFGRDFDHSRNVPWAGQILNDKSLKDKPYEKADKLYDTALENIEKAAGIKPEPKDLRHE
jgi:hypothetical protein